MARQAAVLAAVAPNVLLEKLVADVDKVRATALRSLSFAFVNECFPVQPGCFCSGITQ